MKKMIVALGVIGFALVSIGGELTVTGKGVVRDRLHKVEDKINSGCRRDGYGAVGSRPVAASERSHI